MEEDVMAKLPTGVKRIVLTGDYHCGHRAGLTPPDWQLQPETGGHIWQKFLRSQKEMWKRYLAIVKALQPVTCLLVNGDAIDGRGERSGGVELITGDRSEQCDIAEECIAIWDAEKIVMTRGTPYHAGSEESWEDVIAKALRKRGNDVKIGEHEWPSVNGYVFDCKHHLGSSSTPYGRYTAVAKEDLWNLLWNERGLQPRADMVVRSHVHYCVGGYRYVSGKRKEFLSLPALQTMGTRYGARRCSGTVDWGVLGFDIDKHGSIICLHDHVQELESTVAKATPV
jgi:hypothetical protein